MNKMYGFEGEVKAKYSANMCDLFTEVYNWLPLCHLLNHRVSRAITWRGERDCELIDICSRSSWCTEACSPRTTSRWTRSRPRKGTGSPRRRGSCASCCGQTPSPCTAAPPARGVWAASSGQMSQGGSWRTTASSTSSGVTKWRWKARQMDTNNWTLFRIMGTRWLTMANASQCFLLLTTVTPWVTRGPSLHWMVETWHLNSQHMRVSCVANENKIYMFSISAVPHPNVKPMAYANSLLSLFG